LRRSSRVARAPEGTLLAALKGAVLAVRAGLAGIAERLR
jgi:hypothetical protein